MKQIALFLMLFAIAVAFALDALPAGTGGKILSGRGRITGIDVDSSTVVVEIPRNGRLYTVGGRLSPDAVLTNGGQEADLSLFRPGDVVRVGWTRVSAGHGIESQEAGAALLTASLTNQHSPLAMAAVIGTTRQHIIGQGETLLDIARKYGLGINEIQDLYPELDPWVTPEGMALIIPSRWILPAAKIDGIVINVPELRLYYAGKEQGTVLTHPLGLGEEDWETPLGLFRIGEKAMHPTWYIPASLQAKHQVRSVPPGPDNPLGEFWMGLGKSSYGIHGTDMPWSVGRLVTHGCIRMYPEDIRAFYPMVRPGTPVRIIYEPVKFGLHEDQVFMEVHRDIYNKVGAFVAYGYRRLREENMVHRVDLDKFRRALVRKDGMPTDISL